MPFIQRIVEPVFLSRPTQSTATEQQPSNVTRSLPPPPPLPSSSPSHDDFTSIANCTLANILRQLASVVLVADQILSDLGNELQTIRDRSNHIQKRIIIVEKSLETIDTTIIYKPNKKNFIDDNDVSIYKTKRTISTSLFTAATRPQHIQRMYEKAAPTPVVPICSGDASSENNFSACPLSFGHTRRQITKKIDAEIETRMPAAIEELRKWTSAEAIGEITVAPNCLVKVGTSSLYHNNSTIAEESYASFSTSYVDGIDVTSTSTNDNVDGVNDVPLDHKLPSPEEQCKMIASKYPAEIVPVNTSKVRFERMCSIRKSLGHVPMGKIRYQEENQVTRRSLRPKKAGKRRNTIAGIDDKDIKEAYTQMRHSAVVGNASSADEKTTQSMPRSKSNDLLRSNGTIDSLRSSNRFTNFKALKQWGRHRFKFNKIDENAEGEINQNGAHQNENLKVTKTRTKTPAEKALKQNPLYSSTEKLFTNLIENDVKSCSSPTHPVKLRNSMTRRQRRNKQYRCEEPNSSSGNWSASSESGRTSASSEVTIPKKSSNSCSSLNQNKPSPISSCPSALTKRRINTSTSSSITSDDTLAHEVPSGYIDLFDDNESQYSCDTEGYFTSFHVDSGLKTLKEEETSIVPAMLSTSALLPIDGSNVSSNLTDSLSRTTISVDSDYELFGKGSTSTTASSGTVCTALLGSLSNNSLVEMPVAPERKSSLNSKLMNISNYGKPKQLTSKNVENISRRSNEKGAKQTSIEARNSNNDSMQDSSHGVASPISDLEISENSDFESVERVKRIRGKTQINTNRIPSICIITPLNSDDEDRVAAMESMLSSLNINQKDLPLNDLSKEKTVAQVHSPQLSSKNPLSNTEQKKPHSEKEKEREKEEVCTDSAIETTETASELDDEYVTITDVGPRPNYRVSDIVCDDLERVLSGNLNEKTEYVSLNELPCNNNYDGNLLADDKNVRLISGTNVKFNANGMFVYDSSTLRYKRSLCTTFKGMPIASQTVDVTDSCGNVSNDKQNQEIANQEKRMSSKCSPPFEKMASNSDSDGLDDVYVTLATDKCELNNLPKPFISVSDSELSDTSKDVQSDTWPAVDSNRNKIEEMKRRFSWENITKTKESKRKSKRRTHKFLLPISFSARKTPSKPKFTFKTSTPLKNAGDKEISTKGSVNESSFGNSISLSQVTFNKASNAQTTTCSDRLGTPKTSLNDFKKLLLNATNKKLTSKPSAVEQLKLKHESPMKILDLSSSPKSFMNRRILQQTPTSSSSPYKKTNLMSPRSRWKYNNFNKNSIASIPEVNIEEDSGSANDGTVSDSTVNKSDKQKIDNSESNVIYKTPQKSSISRDEEATSQQIANVSTPQAPIAKAESLEPINAQTESSPETGVIETSFSMKENLFRQAEENNFMRGEIKTYGASLAKKHSQKITPDVSKITDEPSDTTVAPTLETSF